MGTTAQDRLAGAYVDVGGPSPAPFHLMEVSLCGKAAAQHPELVPHLYTPGNARRERNILQEWKGTQDRGQLKSKCGERGGLKEREAEVHWREDGEAEAQRSVASSNVLGSPLLSRLTPRCLYDLEAYKGASGRRDFRAFLENSYFVALNLMP